jgi:hypothetical protein
MVLDPTLNGENVRFWLTFFIGFVFAHFLSIWHEEDIIQQLKAWSFRMWKNVVHTQSNSDTIARWSSITFFWYTLYMAKHTRGASVRVKTRYFEKFKINIFTLCRIQTKLSTRKHLNTRSILLTWLWANSWRV